MELIEFSKLILIDRIPQKKWEISKTLIMTNTMKET